MHPTENVSVPQSRHSMFANDESRRPAFVRYFGLRENPFRTTSDPRYLLLTNQTRHALDGLLCGIDARVGLLVLTGEVGAGKTVLLNTLLEALRQRGTPRAFVFNSHLETDDLFEMALADFGAPPDPAAQTKPLVRMQRWLLDCYRANSNAVLVIDEAQGLRLDVLEAIRMLLNMEPGGEKLLQIVLAGQPEFDTKINLPELRQLRQRVSVRYRLGALSLEETCLYIEHRLRVAGSTGESPFEAESLAAIHYYARGTPRVINALCEQSLMKACSEQTRPVAPRTVEEIAFQFQVDGNKPVGTPVQLGDLMLMNAVAARSRRTNATRADAAPAGINRVEPPSRAHATELPAEKRHEAACEPVSPPIIGAEAIAPQASATTVAESVPVLEEPVVETPIALVPAPAPPKTEVMADDELMDPIQMIVSAASDTAASPPSSDAADPTAARAEIAEPPAGALDVAPAESVSPAPAPPAPPLAQVLVLTAAAGATSAGTPSARPVALKPPATRTPQKARSAAPPVSPSIRKPARPAPRPPKTAATLSRTHLSLLASLSSIERVASNWLRWLREPIGSGRAATRGKAR